MKTQLSILLFLMISAVHPQGKPLESFMPAGWKILATTKGDLNKDMQDDAALVIENTNSNNLILNKEGMGHDTLNVNPRRLIVLFKDTKGYILKTHNDWLIPSQNDSIDYCLDNPFIKEATGFYIKKGILGVSFETEASCGHYEAHYKRYQFRFDDNELVLIGYDESVMDKIKGDAKQVSINYLTRKKVTTTGQNQFENWLNHPKTVITSAKLPRPILLSELDNEWENHLGF